MATIPASGGTFWPSTILSIPANWNQDASGYATKHLCGAGSGVDSGGTGGGNHSHTSASAHRHSTTSHTHTFSGSTITTTYYTLKYQKLGGTDPWSVAGYNHGHDSATSYGPSTSYTGYASTTSSSNSAEGEYYEVVLIVPADGNQNIPVGACVFIDNPTVPTNFAVTDGSGGTPNINNKFLKMCAAGVSAGTTGGATTHTHTWPDTHLHSYPHSHAAKDASYSTTSYTGQLNFTDLGDCWYPYHHTVAINSETIESSNDSAGTISTESNDPAFEYLLLIQKTGVVDIPNNIIIPYLSTIASIPSDWKLCDGTNNTPDLRNKFVKATSQVNYLLSTNTGVNSHYHSTASHNHTFGGHDHEDSATQANTDWQYYESGTPSANFSAHQSHSHEWAIGETTPTMTATTFNTDSSDRRPAYKEVLWIKLVPPVTVQISGNIQMNGNISIL